MQCHYFLIMEGEEATDARFQEEAEYHRFNTLWWFEWPLENLARELGVRPLTEFISLSRAELASMMGEEEVARVEREGWAGDGATALKTEWFPPEDGARTVLALLEQIRSHPQSLADAQPGERHNALVGELVAALESLQADLARIGQQRKLFRLYKQ